MQLLVCRRVGGAYLDAGAIKVVSNKQVFSVVTIGIAALCFMGLAIQLTVHSRERLLRAESIEVATQWFGKFEKSTAQIEQIFDGDARGAKGLGTSESDWLTDVFYYEIHHQKRGQVYRSANSLTGRKPDIIDRKPQEGEAESFAKVQAELIESKGADWPQIYSETTLPLVKDGRRIGSIVIFADQTKRAALYKKSFGFLTSGLLILMAFGSALAGSIIAKKIREHQRAENRVRYLAHHDSLTGSLNRASFNEALEDLLSEPQELGSDRKSPTLMWIDLDKFKEVNDSFGHAFGDALLKHVSERLEESVEPGDIVARVGGDEFAILCVSPRSKADLEELAQIISDKLNTFVCIDEQFVPCGACIGIAPYPDAGKSAIQLVQAADLAMYNAKTNGRKGYRFYDPSMQDQMQERRELEQALVRALDREEFEVYYQPQVNLDNKDIAAYEALVRWHHPEKGVISPSDFIPVAEETGLIKQLGEWVLIQACKDAAKWKGRERIAVNLSAAQFKDDHVLKAVNAALAESGLPPERLELEITESLLFHDPERALTTLSTLKGMGVKVAMDDFGTGYSSLAHLWRFPFDKIKIDRSFVKNIEHNPKVAKIITSIIDLGRALDIRITAEGVEHEYQAEFLRDRDCEFVQGFYYGRPVPNQDLKNFVQQIEDSKKTELLPQLLQVMKQIDSADSLSPEAGVKILDALVKIAKATDEAPDTSDATSSGETDEKSSVA